MFRYILRAEPPDELRSVDPVSTLAEAMRQADSYVFTHPHSSIDVIPINLSPTGDDHGSTEEVVYHLDPGVIPG